MILSRIITCACLIFGCTAILVKSEDAAEDYTPGGIIGFPGVKTVSNVVAKGAFADQLTAPCDESNKLPDACMSEIEKYPKILAAMIRLDAAALMSADIDMAPICEACDPDAVIAYMDSVRDQYKDGDANPTCDGIIPDTIASDAVYDLMKAMIRSSCVKNDEGAYCYNSDIIPTALSETGLIDIMSAIDFQNLDPVTLSSLITGGGSDGLDTGKICKGFAQGGCCSGMLLDVLSSTIAMTCVKKSSPLLSTVLQLLPGLCTGDNAIPESCGEFKNIVDKEPLPSSPDECPDFATLMESFESAAKLEDTIFSECALDSGVCPKNDCEMFLCGPHVSDKLVG